jgi:hypothetical protein
MYENMRIIESVNLLFTTCVKKLFIATTCSTGSLDEPKKRRSRQ